MVWCVGFTYFGIWPCGLFRGMQIVAMEGELGGVVDAIKRDELAYYNAHGHYLAVPEAPRSRAGANRQAVVWNLTPEWAELGWDPVAEGPLFRGVYWVVLTRDGFEVHGVCDLDEDGVQREKIAMQEQHATLVDGRAH